MKNSKKVLWISGITLDVGVTGFLFVVSIIMLATMPDAVQRKIIEQNGPKNFIEWFQINPTAYLWIGVIPLFVLLIGNIAALVYYVKKATAKKKVALNELSAEEKEALRKELLKDLSEKQD